MEEDLSGDDLSEETTILTRAELQERRNNIRLDRSFRKWSFWGVAIFTAIYLVAFLAAAFVLLTGISASQSGFMKYESHLWTLCLILLAVIPTTLALSLLRFAFRDKNEGKEDKDMPGLWLQLAKEITDVLKAYLTKKS